MKWLTLVRHGRALWKAGEMTDFDRPLDRRGVREATDMAKRLAPLEPAPDCILASPAQRAHQTATIFARILGLGERRILAEERLYLAQASELLAAVRDLGPHVGHAMLVGHNPGLSEFARRLAPEAAIGEFATGATCRIALAAPGWDAVGFGDGREVVCDAPKPTFALFT